VIPTASNPNPAVPAKTFEALMRYGTGLAQGTGSW
jgi:hypothetical protein